MQGDLHGRFWYLLARIVDSFRIAFKLPLMGLSGVLFWSVQKRTSDPGVISHSAL